MSKSELSTDAAMSMAMDMWETIDCPICGGSSFAPRYRIALREFMKGNLRAANLSLIGCTPETIFNYSECRGCGFITTNPRLTAAANKVFYNGFKSAAAPAQAALQARPSIRRTIKMLKAHRDLVLAIGLCGGRVSRANRDGPPLRLLDYGCGYGYMLELARTFGLDAAGVDLSESRILKARAMGFRAGRREEMLGGETYDIVLSQSVVEHANDLNQYMDDIASALRPGGVLICNGLTQAIVEIERRRGRYKLVHPISHLNLMTRRNLGQLLAKHRFRVPSRIELWNRLGAAGWSVYARAPYVRGGTIAIDGGDIHAVAFKA